MQKVNYILIVVLVFITIMMPIFSIGHFLVPSVVGFDISNSTNFGAILELIVEQQ
jgi:hypothetical protein